MATLFDSFTLGTIPLAHRIAMAPLTRNRAAAGMVPGPFAAYYYAQRASAGLLIAEATQVSQQGQGHQDTPGNYTDAQVEGWRTVTDAVHAAGGKIFLQLWHVGRVSHADLQEHPSHPRRSAPTARSMSAAASSIARSPRRSRSTRSPASARRSAVARPMRSVPASTGSRFMAPTAICSTRSPRMAPTIATTAIGGRPRTAPG